MIGPILLFSLAVFSSSCLPDTSHEKRSILKSVDNGPKKSDVIEREPEFPHGQNFFQDGLIEYPLKLKAYKHMDRYIYLRGQGIHEYLQVGEHRNEDYCLVVEFPLPTSGHEVLVVAANASTFSNLKTSAREHYLLLSPNRDLANRRCQSTLLEDKVNGLYNNSPLVYQMSSVCSSCPDTMLTSSSLGIYRTSGKLVDDLDVGHIKILLFSQEDSFDSSPGPSCKDNRCSVLGYDCCIDDQCVKDKSIKSTVDRSDAEFMRVQELLVFNPSQITDYTHFYNICSESTVANKPLSTDFSDSDWDQISRLQKKRELYNCVNPIEGEMSLCTVTYKSPDDGLRYSGGPGTADDGTIYSTGLDDLNFNTIYSGPRGGLPKHSIHSITYAGIDLFRNNTFLKPGFSIEGVSHTSSSTQLIRGNDNFVQPMNIKIYDHLTQNRNFRNKEVKITYKTDGSCLPLNDNIAQCKKIYIQGQDLGKVTDHYPASQNFFLPVYANIRMPIRVLVDNEIKIRDVHWDLVSSTHKSVEFIGDLNEVFDTQRVELIFYVDLNTTNVLGSVQSAREEIGRMCQCKGISCNYAPVEDNKGNVVDYECVYPKASGASEKPFEKTIFLSTKTVPVRYFDVHGTPHSKINTQTPKQEGTAFEYINGELHRPNNVNNYIGFNEIYGTLNDGTLKGPRPAKKISVLKGKVYNIFAERGTFSSCLTCGHDYWSTLLRLFPRNLTNKGGGYVPNFFETNPSQSTTYRKDDLLFGRACFLPVTMIPWSHQSYPNESKQRLARQSAQHFLFANGYQRDWYGFDYGSVIGSWDGIIWFSIGNERKVTAKSNHLFLAVNTYWGGLVDEGDFTISISEQISQIPDSGSKITNDYESDGAECQKYHTCQNDQDCITKLGWDYACESIVGLKTLWPKTNNQGRELPDSEELRSLRFLFDQFHGPKKRCVYRGRGAPCYQHYRNVHADTAFNGSNRSRHLVCSNNNYCRSFVNVTKNKAFNTQIARSGKSVAYQNDKVEFLPDRHDLFGLHIPIVGRPLDWNGKQSIPREALSNMSYNSVQSICIPGREPSETIKDMNNNVPSRPEFMGDRALGIGMTEFRPYPTEDYFAACPILNKDGNLVHFDYETRPHSTDIGGMSLAQISSMENTSTNALSFLDESIVVKEERPYADFDADWISKPKLEKDRCLRMPGAACFSDYDCMSSPLITKSTKRVQEDDTRLNQYELSFWQEELVCSQKKGPREPDYRLEDNRCCREMKKNFTVGTWIDGQSDFDHILPSNEVALPGVNIRIDSPRRYGLYNIVSDKLAQGNYPVALQGPQGDDCGMPSGCLDKEVRMDHQYTIFPLIPERVCCNGDWVREFHQSNGGGHQWEAQKHQLDFDLANFQCYNWIDRDQEQLDIIGQTGIKNPLFSCSLSEDPLDPDCGIRAVLISQAEDVLNWIGNLELAGIPQATMARPWSVVGTNHAYANLFCEVNVNDQTAAHTAQERRIPGVFNTSVDVAEIVDNDGFQYFSLGDHNNFNSSQIKQVFSEDKIACCIPAGEEVMVEREGATPDEEKCCTGYISPDTGRCALRDYTNVSVYFNRFVSSALKDIAESRFDANGFLKSKALVEFFACQKKVCASGVLARGVAWSHARVPGKSSENQDVYVRQFLDSDNREEDNFNGLVDLFEAGLRWNTHVYCVPSEIDTDAPELVVIQCQ